MRIRWLSRALRDLESVAEYIATDNPSAAIAMVERVEYRVSGLADHPESGRTGREPGTRELIVSGSPYLVVYRLSTSTVDVLRVLHGAQQWPP